MERKRCQVCEGPIVNNRCKLCGMPYRNDETLYHLNENRSEHYRHATAKSTCTQKNGQMGSSSLRKTGQASGTYAQTGTYKQKSVNVGSGSNYRTKSTGSVKEKKKHPLLALLVLLCILSAVIPEIRNIIQDAGLEIAGVRQYELQSADVLTAGDEIPAGHYTASCKDGEIQFMIVGDNQENGIMRVDEENEQKITLSEGDLIGIISAYPSDAVLILTSH